MLSAAEHKWYFLRDRNEWTTGSSEVIAIIRVPVVAGAMAEGKSYELENIGDASIDEDSASIQYTGIGGGHWTFRWAANADESYLFTALIEGKYVNAATGNRKFMPLEEADPQEVETMLAVDALDYYDCTNFKTKKKTGSNEIHAVLSFQGRDPLSKEE